jgi:hypothetical protein
MKKSDWHYDFQEPPQQVVLWLKRTTLTTRKCR